MAIGTRLRKLLFPKPVLNNGSQLRDHLANERTFLSWTRMGLAFAAMALALGRLGMIDHIFNKYAAQLNNHHNNTISTELKTAAIATDKDNHDVTKSSSAGQSSILASQISWSISTGSFG